MAGRRRKEICVEISEQVYSYFYNLIKRDPFDMKCAFTRDTEFEKIVEDFRRINRVSICLIGEYQASKKIQNDVKRTYGKDIGLRWELIQRSIADPYELNDWCLKYVPLKTWKKCLNALAATKKDEDYKRKGKARLSLRVSKPVADAFLLMCEEKGTTPEKYLSKILRRERYLTTDSYGTVVQESPSKRANLLKVTDQSSIIY